MGCLQDRLVADLHSGLPREHCGWTGLTELDMAVGRMEESVAQGIDNLRQRAANAGFASETIQQRADGIRLNPKVAAIVILRAKKISE